jgi:hypothetical protein
MEPKEDKTRVHINGMQMLQLIKKPESAVNDTAV